MSQSASSGKPIIEEVVAGFVWRISDHIHDANRTCITFRIVDDKRNYLACSGGYRPSSRTAFLMREGDPVKFTLHRGTLIVREFEFEENRGR